MQGAVTRAIGMPTATLSMIFAAKHKRTMDVGDISAFTLLSIYDSHGDLSTQPDMKPPAGVRRIVIRCQGAGGGNYDSSNAAGSQPRHFKSTGGSGGAWAKTTLPFLRTSTLTNSNSWNGYDGRGIAVDGVQVCFAQAGLNADSTGAPAGGSDSHSLGDVRRYGGQGGASGTDSAAGGNGQAGQNGSLGTLGGYDTCTACDAYGHDVTDGHGGSGGSGGDFGDADGIGFGWDPVTKLQRSGPQPARTTIHFYGYR